jgi:hypothetical protein
VTGWRRQIQTLGEGDYDQRRAAWREGEDAVHDVRLIGDLCIAAFFGAEKDKDREALRRAYAAKVDAWKAGGDRSEIEGIVEALRGGDKPVAPLHWEIEFPEVFGRGRPGFDAIVGNPPFAGKNTTAHASRPGFTDWLKVVHVDSHGNADLVAHFYRRSFSMLRERGAFGLIATNTIGQGDTRTTGLRWICTHGGHVYSATKRVKWPGLAAVVVSVVHVFRGAWVGARRLDGRDVDFISAFLFAAGGHDDPYPLTSNNPLAFQGPIFPQHQQIGDGERTLPLTLLDEANAKASLSRFVRPYVGGDEFLSDATFVAARWVVDLDGLSREQALSQAGRLFEAIEHAFVANGGGCSTSSASRKRAEFFWLPSSPAREARQVLDNQERVLMHPFTAVWLSFGFLPRGTIVGGPHNVIAIETFDGFAVLQSRPHEIWARFFGSTLEDRLRYTPSDCFETFPFPPNWQTDPALEAAGQAYYDFRAALMVRNDEGLTKTYNRFHDPNEHDADILRLRELHAAMDRAVFDAYGWTDLATDCDFFLDYEIDEATWGDKKKPYRYRWPDAVRDDVLARLLDLNQRRHQEEVAAGLHGKVEGATPGPKPKATPKTPRTPAKRAPKSKAQSGQATLGLPLDAERDAEDDAS